MSDTAAPLERKLGAHTLYEDGFKTVVLAILEANGGNVKATLRELAKAGMAIPRSTLRGWKKAARSPDEERARALELLASAVELGVQRYAAVLINPEVIAELVARAPRDAATTFGILFDKLQLLRGKPTSILGGEGWRKLLEKVREAAAKNAPAA